MMKRFTQNVFMIAMSTLLLTSCATSSEQGAPASAYKQQMVGIKTIDVVTPGVSGAQCTFFTNDYKYTVTTPGQVQIDRSNPAVNYTCVHEGYEIAKGIVSPRKNAWVVADMLNDVIPGKKYDISSQRSFDYPGIIKVEMKKRPAKISRAASGKDAAGHGDDGFAEMLAETEWVVNGDNAVVDSKDNITAGNVLKPLEDIQEVGGVRAVANASPQDGDTPAPYYINGKRH